MGGNYPDYKGWYSENALRLTGRGIWLRGQELNTLPEEEFEKRAFSVLLARLSTYEDSGSSFTLPLLYRVARDMDGVFPDMAFLPPRNDLRLFQAGNVPWLLPVRTKTHPCRFDLIAFSNSVLLELVNLPAMLRNSGIPLSKKERMDGAGIPLVILGGANAPNTSSLFSVDPMVDGIFCGEDTGLIGNIFETCRDGREQGLSKSEILLKLEEIQGFFQPEKMVSGIGCQEDNTVSRKILPRAADVGPAPVLYSAEAGSGFLQISEGCPFFCSFCSESWNRKPYHEYELSGLVAAARKMKREQGLHNIELFSFNFNVHSGFYSLLWELADIFPTTGLKSQRFDWLADDPEMLKYLQVVGKMKLTCGMEGISARLRKFLNKNLDDDTLFRSIRAILDSPVRELKIFLIATGREEAADYAALQDTLGRINDIVAVRPHRPRIVFSVTPLVCFPHTPLEFEEAARPETMDKALDSICRIILRAGFEVRQSASVSDYRFSQLLARAGDPGFAAALIRLYEETGYVYYRNIPDNIVSRFAGLLKEEATGEAGPFAGYPPEQRPGRPWSGIHTGVDAGFLGEAHRMISAGGETPSCFGTGKCSACGVCPDSGYRDGIIFSKQEKNYKHTDLHRKIQEKRKSIKPVKFCFSGGSAGLGLPGGFRAQALARAIMAAYEELTDFYAGYGGSFWDTSGKGAWITGDDIITLNWYGDGISLLEGIIREKEFTKKVNEHIPGEWGLLKRAGCSGPANVRLIITSVKDIDPRNYLEASRLKYTLRKTSGSSFVYEFSRDSLKKNIILSLTKNVSDGLTALVLDAGIKFNLEKFNENISGGQPAGGAGDILVNSEITEKRRKNVDE